MAANVITGGFTGRMGNQMFQIAAVIALALKHNVPYTFQRATDNDPWRVYFNHFPELPVENRQYHNEHVGSYEEIPYNGGALCLCGYYQSYKYFEHYRKEIIEAFCLKQYPTRYNKVSIHVRRGDYVEGGPFEPVSIQYIRAAVNNFTERKDENGQNLYSFVVFSDDIEWCKQNINSNTLPGLCFEYSEGRDEYEDISLMAACEHNIIANSTFSWWGAWLNQNPNKIVIAPTKWFNGVNKDLLLDEWIKI